MIIKVPLAFPSTLDYGSYVQQVPNIKATTSVELFFNPQNGYLKNVLIADGRLKLTKNQKLMEVAEKFYLPAEFSCY